MENTKHTREDGLKFLASMDLEYPPIHDFVLTNSGIMEPMPTKLDDWEQFKLNTEKKQNNDY
jgi:hypothetical protein